MLFLYLSLADNWRLLREFFVCITYNAQLVWITREARRDTNKTPLDDQRETINCCRDGERRSVQSGKAVWNCTAIAFHLAQ